MREIKKMTEDEILFWYDSYDGDITFKSVVDFARHCGILKEKVKRCDWWYKVFDDGHLGITGIILDKTKDEMLIWVKKNAYTVEWGKCEGTDTESDE